MAFDILPVYKKTFGFVIASCCVLLGNGEFLVIPKDTEAGLGNTVTFYCKSSISTVEWHHLPVGQSIHEVVYQGGYIFNGYKERFSANKADDGECNLVIKNVKETDAGKFTCMEKSEDATQRTAELIVFEKYPSNTSCAVKLTCAPDCDAMELTCGMKSYGNIIPSMEWRESGNGIVTSNPSLDNGITISSIQLQPNSANGRSYSCNVKYPTHSPLVSQFRWHYTVTASLGLPPEASPSLQVQSLPIAIVVIMTSMGVALIGLLAFVGFMSYFFRKKRKKAKSAKAKGIRNKEYRTSKDVENGLESQDVHLLPDDEDREEIGFIPRIALNKSKSIHGIGVLGNELFLVTKDGCVVEVFDLESRKFKRAWMVEGLVNPNDMAVCPVRNHIFICDWKKAAENGEIFCCDKNGKLNYSWISESGRGRISVTKETNVIVAESWYNTIREYKYSGQLINKFDTVKQKFHLWHAVKLESGNFVASFGDTHDEIQEICIIDSQGMTLNFINQDSIPEIDVKISVPRSLAVDKDGTIYISDLYNCRIILLTPELQYKGKIDEGENEEKLRGPLRICIHEFDNKRQLMVADNVKKNKNWTDGKVLVWNLKPALMAK